VEIAQKVHLALILIPGVSLGLGLGLLKQKSGSWMLRYGALLAVPGAFLPVLANKKVSDVLLLIDTGGFGRMYVVGCMLCVAGVIALLVQIIRKSMASGA